MIRQNPSQSPTASCKAVSLHQHCPAWCSLLCWQMHTKIASLVSASDTGQTMLPTVYPGATSFIAEPMWPKTTELTSRQRNTRGARPELQETSKPPQFTCVLLAGEGSIPGLATSATSGHHQTNYRNSWGCFGHLRLRRTNKQQSLYSAYPFQYKICNTQQFYRTAKIKIVF